MQPPDAEQPRLRVVIADDQAIVREGLVTLLGMMPNIDVVAAARDGEQAIALTAEHDPDVVLMDLGMPRVDGIAATGQIRRDHPRTQVVVLTTFAEEDAIIAALQAGAIGFLTKDAGRTEIARALHTAAAGQAVLDPQVYARLVARAATSAPTPSTPPSPALPDGLTASTTWPDSAASLASAVPSAAATTLRHPGRTTRVRMHTHPETVRGLAR